MIGLLTCVQSQMDALRGVFESSTVGVEDVLQDSSS